MKQESEQFKIEATPVIDLKKSAKIDVWDNEKTEVYLEDEGEGSTAYLVDSEGEYIPISAFPFVIGRGNECDLVLNKKGISRKHAEIVFQSGRFVVNDLDSLNGLKVNGYKVARVILEEGDSIKLGEVGLVFSSSKSSSVSKVVDLEHSSGSAAAVSKGAAGKSKIKRLGTIGVVSVFIIAGAFAVLSFNNNVSDQLNSRVVVAPSPNVNEQQDPNVGEHGDKANTGQIENPVASLNADQDVASTGHVTGNQDIYAPPPSIASSMAEPDATKQDSHVAGIEKRTEVSEPKSKTILTKPVIASLPKKTPVDVAKREPQRTVNPAKVSNAAAAENVHRANSVIDVTSIDSRYLSGNVEAVLAEMRQNVQSGKVSDSAYKDRYNKLLSLFNKYSAGKQAYIEGRKSDAANQWAAFMKEEKAIFGSKRSAMATSVASKMADEYVALGNAAAKAGKHHDAYRFWQNSLGFGDSVAARIALDAANQKSKQLYRQALRLEYVNTERAKELWRQVMEIVPPGSEYYTKASSKLAWYEKWGA